MQIKFKFGSLAWTDDQQSCSRKSQKGVAIILVIFVIALSSIMVVNLTYSTFLNSRTVGMIERGLQSEYLLKSVLNLSQALVDNDISPNSDSRTGDLWGLLPEQLPLEFFGLSQGSSQGLQILLNITPKNSKLNLNALRCVSATASNPNLTAQSLENLFKDILDFDNSLDEPEESWGRFAGQTFDSSQTVANLIDWQDADDQSCSNAQFNGIEGNFPRESIFNRQFTLLSQADNVPGMTAGRMSAAAPFITVSKSGGVNIGRINLNVASPEVLSALGLNSDELNQVTTELGEGQVYSSIPDFITDQSVVNQLTTKSQYFEIYAQIKYGNVRSFFMRAEIDRGNQANPGTVFLAEYY